MAYRDQPVAAADPSPLATPYTDRSPRLSEAGPSQPAVSAAGLPRPSSPYAGAAAATPLAAAAADAPHDRSRLQRLRDADPEWLWKASLRAVLLVAGAIGLAGSAVVAADRSYYSGGYGDEDLVPYALVPFTASFIWCAIVFLVPILSRRCRPVHPGVVVAFDLIFWIGLIVSLGITIVGYSSFASDYSGPVRPVPTDDYRIRSYRDDGGYVQAANGTWVYTASIEDDYDIVARATVVADASTAVSATTTPATTTPSTAAPTTATITPPPVLPRATTTSDPFGDAFPSGWSTSSYSDPPYDPYSTDGASPEPLVRTATQYFYSDDVRVTRTVVYSHGIASTLTGSVAAASTPSPRRCSSTFASCAEQDAYVNRLFHHAARDTPLALLAAVLLALLLLLHFVLFVWACVDTHRHNRRAAVHAAFDLGGAGGIALIENLRQHGYVMVPAESVQGTAFAAGVPGAGAGAAAEKAAAGSSGRFA